MESPVIANGNGSYIENFAPEKVTTSWITPFRVALIDILYQYLQTHKSQDVPYLGLNWKERVLLCQKILHWMVGPDLTAGHFKSELNEIKPDFGTFVFSGLEARQNEIDHLSTLFKDVDRIVNGEKLLRSPLVDSQSPVGLFLRRHSLMFKNLTLMQASKLSKWFAKYVSQVGTSKPPGNIDDDFDNFLDENSTFDISGLSIEDKKLDECENSVKIVPNIGVGSFLFSKKQSEYFIAKQISSLLRRDESALQAKDLHKVTKHLLTINEHQSEVLYLHYLNSLRVRDYTVCLNTLIRYFDSKSNAIGSNVNNFATQSNDEIAKSFRFAALNLSIFHVEMGHWDIAELSIKEAIRMALEANDMTCLQHALMWMEIIREEKSEIFEANQFCSGLRNRYSSGSSFSGNSDMTFRSWVQKVLQDGGPPCMLIKLIDANASAYVESTLGESSTGASTANAAAANALTGTSLSTQYVLQARAWKSYGFSHLASLCFQLTILSGQSQPTNTQSITSQSESSCIALTELAGILKEQGSAVKYNRIVEFLTKENFLNLSTSKHVMALKNLISCKDAVLKNDSKMLESSAARLKMFSPQLADVYYATYKFALRNSTKSLHLLSKVLNSEAYPDVIICARCAMADLLFDSKNFSGAINFHLLQALELSKSLFMVKVSAELECRIAVCYFMLGNSEKCLKLMESSLMTVVTESALPTRISVMSRYFQCLLRKFSGENKNMKTEERKLSLDVLKTVMFAVDTVLALANGSEVIHLRKEVLVLKSFLCKLLGQDQDAFNFAKQFNLLNEEFKSAWPSFVIS